MSNHTPGPWTIQQAGYESYILGRIRGGRVASIYESDQPTDEERANARLIAAAPELLEACRGVLGLFDRLVIRPDGDHDSPDTDPAYIATLGEFARLRAVIAKAEGAQ
jgi:hypothetical protein